MESKDKPTKELNVSVINVQEAKEPVDAREPEFTDLRRTTVTIKEEPQEEPESEEATRTKEVVKSTPIISTEPTFVQGRPARHGEILVNYGYYGAGYPGYYSAYPAYGYGYAHTPRLQNRSREPCLDCCGNPCCCCGQPCCYV